MTKKIVYGGLIAVALVLTPVIIFGQNVAHPQPPATTDSQPVQTTQPDMTAAVSASPTAVQNLCSPSPNPTPPPGPAPQTIQHTWNGKPVFTSYFTVSEVGVVIVPTVPCPGTTPTPTPSPTPAPNPTPPPGPTPQTIQHTWNGKPVFTGYFTVGENGVTVVR
jgi:hypothetical protein